MFQTYAFNLKQKSEIGGLVLCNENFEWQSTSSLMPDLLHVLVSV